MAAPAALPNSARVIEAKIDAGRADEITEAEAQELIRADNNAYFRLASRLPPIEALRTVFAKRPWEEGVANLRLKCMAAGAWGGGHNDPAIAWAECYKREVINNVHRRRRDRLVSGGQQIYARDLIVEFGALDFYIWRLSSTAAQTRDLQRAAEMQGRSYTATSPDDFMALSLDDFTSPLTANEYQMDRLVKALARLHRGGSFADALLLANPAASPGEHADLYRELFKLAWSAFSSSAREAIISFLARHPAAATRDLAAAVTVKSTSSLAADMARVLRHAAKSMRDGTIDEELVQALVGIKRQFDPLIQEASEQVAKKPKLLAPPAAAAEFDSDSD